MIMHTSEALEVVIQKGIEKIRSKYGSDIDDKILAGFLTTAIKEYFILNTKVSRRKEVEELVTSATKR